MKIRRSAKKIIFLFLIAALIFITKPCLAQNSYYTKEIEEIQKQLEVQQKKKQELDEQQKIYQQKIEEKRKEASTLKNELSILENQIYKQKIVVRTKENEIQTNDLEIKDTQFKILQKQKEIIEQKNKIAEVLRLINQNDKKNLLQIAILSNSLSDVLGWYRRLDSLQGSLLGSLNNLEEKKKDLVEEEKNAQTKRQELVSLKHQLESEKGKLDSQKIVQTKILDETRGAEWRFQSLLAEAISEQKKTEREISSLEKQIREGLNFKAEEEGGLMEGEGEIIFSWPVPSGIVTAYFHDPDYPYRRWIGEHSGVDIRAGQGTAVRAAASGYVAKAFHGGMGYSYVLIIHNEEFSTLYGHLSQINVEEGSYIRRGQVIGKSGGMPGTPGAGYFSTGPHLHFEVRLKGIPVNPLNYLL